MLKPGQKFIIPDTPYFRNFERTPSTLNLVGKEAQVVTVTDFHYRVWTTYGLLFFALDEVNNLLPNNDQEEN